MSDKSKPSGNQAERRDKLLLNLLKTPPQPRPKRERDTPKSKSAKHKKEKPAD